MSPKLQALKDALDQLDRLPASGLRGHDARRALHAAATAAGFTPQRAVEDWARYQIAVGEAADQLGVVEEPEPASGELFA